MQRNFYRRFSSFFHLNVHWFRPKAYGLTILLKERSFYCSNTKTIFTLNARVDSFSVSRSNSGTRSSKLLRAKCVSKYLLLSLLQMYRNEPEARCKQMFLQLKFIKKSVIACQICFSQKRTYFCLGIVRLNFFKQNCSYTLLHYQFIIP